MCCSMFAKGASKMQCFSKLTSVVPPGGIPRAVAPPGRLTHLLSLNDFIYT